MNNQIESPCFMVEFFNCPLKFNRADNSSKLLFLRLPCEKAAFKSLVFVSNEFLIAHLSIRSILSTNINKNETFRCVPSNYKS